MSWLAIQLLIAAALIALNGCFVLAEFALVKVRASRLELLVRRGSQRAALVQAMLQNLDVYLSAIQMGITMTSLGLGWIGEPAVAALLRRPLQRLPLPYKEFLAQGLSFGLAFGLITFLHILLGELVPRSIALQRSERVSLWAAFPLKAFYLAFKTPVTILAQTSIRVLRCMGMTPAAEAETQFSEDEMRIILGSSEEKAGFSLERLLLIENIFDFGSAKVADAMVASDKIAWLSLNRSWQENSEVLRSRRFSRYPLCRTGLDSAIGYVHSKDMLWAPGQPPDLEKLRRDILSVGPSDTLQKLLQQFADRGVHMALVRDGQGAVAGLLTLEDILEEIVGEIHDEFDLPQAWSLMGVLVPCAVEVGFDVPDRETLIRRLLARLKTGCPGLDAEESFRIVWEREAKLSSAVGQGVAIPHGRVPGLERPLLAIGRAARSFPFPIPDKFPVRLALLVLTPASAPLAQLKILARIAALLSNENLRRRLLRARSAEHLVEILRLADTVMAA